MSLLALDIIAFLLVIHMCYVTIKKPAKRWHYILTFGFWLGMSIVEMCLAFTGIYTDQSWIDIAFHAGVMAISLYATQEAFDIIRISDEIRKALAGLRNTIREAKIANPDVEVVIMVNPTETDIKDMVEKIIEKDDKDDPSI